MKGSVRNPVWKLSVGDMVCTEQFCPMHMYSQIMRNFSLIRSVDRRHHTQADMWKVLSNAFYRWCKVGIIAA